MAGYVRDMKQNRHSKNISEQA